MKFKTKTGSEYEIVNHPAGDMIRRINASHGKRADGEWVRLYAHSPINVGWGVMLVMQSLTEYGNDDTGFDEEDETPEQTTRVTSAVDEVWV